MERDPILVEREKTHGDFRKNAQVFNEISSRLPDCLSGPQRLAVVMIVAKLARIHSGNSKEKDHWLDIAGYAKLGAEACE